jgi:hypothetical protein
MNGKKIIYKKKFMEKVIKDLADFINDPSYIAILEVTFPGNYDGLLLVNNHYNKGFKYQIETYENIYDDKYEIISINTSYSDIRNYGEAIKLYINTEYKQRIKVLNILKDRNKQIKL